MSETIDLEQKTLAYTPMEDLEALIALGWGDVPQTQIPPDVLTKRRRRTKRYIPPIQHAEDWVMANSEPVLSPFELGLVNINANRLVDYPLDA